LVKAVATEIFADKRMSTPKSEGEVEIDAECAAFKADINRINEYLDLHAPKIEVDCVSEDPESPTKLRSDAKLGLKMNAKLAFMTEGPNSARSTSSRNKAMPLALSKQENYELISSMKERASLSGELHYSPSEASIDPALVANHYAGIVYNSAHSRAERVIFKCEETLRAVSKLQSRDC